MNTKLPTKEELDAITGEAHPDGRYFGIKHDDLDRLFFAAREALRLQEIVEKLPKTADGAPFYPAMPVYLPDHDEELLVVFQIRVICNGNAVGFRKLYSTRAAALAAKEKNNG